MGLSAPRGMRGTYLRHCVKSQFHSLFFLYSCEVFFSVTQGQTHSAIKMIMSEGEVLCGLFGLKTAEMTC